MGLNIDLSSGEGEFVDFFFDLFWGVFQKNSRIFVTGGHFLPYSLKSREKFRINRSRFGKFQFLSDISSHSKIRILIDSTRNQTKSTFIFKNMWKSLIPAGNCLNSRKCDLSAVFRAIESKNRLNLIIIDISLHLYYLLIHMSNIVSVSKYKSLLLIKATGNDVFGILNGHFTEPVEFFDFFLIFLFLLFLVEEFFIIS